MNAIRLYFRFLGVSLRVQTRYRASFILSTLSNFFVSIVELFGIYAMFNRFNTLGDWTLHEVMVFYGMTYMAFAIAEAVMRGFDTSHRYIKSGDFDRFLMRPRSTFLQMLGADFQLLRIGRFINGLIPFVAGVILTRPGWNAIEWAMVIFSILAGSFTYGGLMLMRAFTCFFTTEALEVFNIFTHGGVQLSSYPMNIYTGWLRKLFTYVIPLAAINYWPMSLLLHKNYAPACVSVAAPFLGLAFFGVGMILWETGVRHYRSTGS